MSMQYIRDYYGVPAKRGMRIRYTGDKHHHFGVIVGSRGPHIRARIETFLCGGVHTLHPTWEIEYLSDNKDLADEVQPEDSL